MSAEHVLVAVVLLAFLVSGSALMILWGREESERLREPPFYERARPGPFAVELLETGRRRSAVLRLVRQARPGSLAEAFQAVRHPPAVIVTGVSRQDAEWLVRALEEKGATARVVPPAPDEARGRSATPAGERPLP